MVVPVDEAVSDLSVLLCGISIDANVQNWDEHTFEKKLLTQKVGGRNASQTFPSNSLHVVAQSLIRRK